MHALTITVKNYRCFADSSPLVVEFGSGFTALVGPNNSGKSSFLKLFHELRPLFVCLGNINQVYTLVQGVVVGTSYPNVGDPVEIFHNRNDRALSVELAFQSPGPQHISRIRLICERSQPTNWRAEFFVQGATARLTTTDGHTERDGRHRFASESGEIWVDLEPLIELSRLVGGALYIGPYRNAISEGEGVYYDLQIGTTFINIWNQWKTGPNRKQNDTAQQVTDDIANIFGYDRLEINAAEQNHILQIIADRRSYRLRELGAGLAQFIVLLGNVGTRRPTLILIDEPELNLHPTLQADFLTRGYLRNAQSGMNR